VVASEPGGRVVVEFADGSRVAVARSTLTPQQDGTYRLARDVEGEEVFIPVVAEELKVETDLIARRKVHVRKRVESREELVDAPVVREEVVVERTPVNRFVEGDAPAIREEDGVTIIPVIEEVLVIDKRLVLREEVRVSKRRTTTSTTQKVLLRREVVDIDEEDLGEPDQ
jgi:uncharacterized protein (TIGR02271 family)